MYHQNWCLKSTELAKKIFSWLFKVSCLSSQEKLNHSQEKLNHPQILSSSRWCLHSEKSFPQIEQNKFSILLASCKNRKIPATYPSTFNRKFMYTFWLEPQGVTHANGANFFSAMIIVCPHHLQNIKIRLFLDLFKILSLETIALYTTYKINTNGFCHFQ